MTANSSPHDWKAWIWVALCLLLVFVACAGPRKPAPATQPSRPQPATPQPIGPFATSSPAEAAVPGVSSIHYTIQVGAFSSVERAASYAQLMQAAGLDAYHFVDIDTFYKVRFERFDTKEAALRRAFDLQSKGVIEEFFIVQPHLDTLALDSRAVLRNDIVLAARRFIGIDYQWGGSSVEEGFDCSGLTMTVYRLVGLELPRSASQQYQFGKAVDRDALLPGDLVFFATGRGRRISHVGIYSGPDTFIHAPGRGKSIRSESLELDYFRKRYIGARRYY